MRDIWIFYLAVFLLESRFDTIKPAVLIFCFVAFLRASKVPVDCKMPPVSGYG